MSITLISQRRFEKCILFRHFVKFLSQERWGILNVTSKRKIIIKCKLGMTSPDPWRKMCTMYWRTDRQTFWHLELLMETSESGWQLQVSIKIKMVSENPAWKKAQTFFLFQTWSIVCIPNLCALSAITVISVTRRVSIEVFNDIFLRDENVSLLLHFHFTRLRSCLHQNVWFLWLQGSCWQGSVGTVRFLVPWCKW